MLRPIDELRALLRPYANPALRWLAAITGFLLIALQAPWRIDPATLVPGIDGDWMMTLTEAAARGDISGRDLYATHGWAFQLIGLTARSLHAGHSSYDSTALFAVLLSVLGAAVLVAALLLVRSLDAAGLLLSCAAVSVLSLAQPAWLRPACLVFVAAVTARLLTSGRRLRWRLFALTVVAAGLQSLSFDLGAYAVLTIAGGTVLHVLFDPGQPPRSLRQRGLEAGRLAVPVLAAAALTYLVFTLALSGGAAAPFDYLAVLSRLSSGYTATMGHPWSAPPDWTFALVLLVLFAIAASVADLRSERGAVRAEAAPLLCAALLFMRGGTIRSDVNHIGPAIVPLVALFLVLGLRAGQRLRRRLAATVTFIALAATWPSAGLHHLGLAADVVASPQLLSQRLAELRSLDAARQVYLPGPLRARNTTGLVVFPYLNQFAHLAGRRLVAPLVQPYQATTAGLDRWYADRIGADPAVGEALYALDNIAVGQIDDVPAITRNPAIFAELFRGFRPLGPAGDGYLLLRRSAQTRELPSTPIAFRSTATPALGGVVLAAPAECAVLEVRFGVDYPWTRRFGRPAAWWVSVALGDEPVVTRKVVALDWREFTTFLGLGQPTEMAAVLTGGAPRHAFDRLTFAAADRSLFAVAPRALAVTGLACVNP